MGVGQCPRPGLGAMFPAQTSHKAKFSDPHPLLAGLSIPVSSEVSAHVLFPKTWLFFFLAWEIPWTEEPGGLQSISSHRV